MMIFSLSNWKENGHQMQWKGKSKLKDSACHINVRLRLCIFGQNTEMMCPSLCLIPRAGNVNMVWLTLNSSYVVMVMSVGFSTVKLLFLPLQLITILKKIL